MKKVYLIRHGLPDFPGGKRMCLGRTDIPLGEEGKAQAKAAAEILPPVTAVFSSPLSRAVQTAEAIGKPIILEGLQERYAGDWEGLTFEEIRYRYPELYAARKTDQFLPLPNSESEEDSIFRFCAAMEQAAQMAAGDFAVVAHGGIIALFLTAIGGRRRKPDYAEIIPLTYDHGIFTIQEDNIHA